MAQVVGAPTATLAVASPSETGTITVSATLGPDAVRLQVEDEGIGIPAEHQPRGGLGLLARQSRLDRVIDRRNQVAEHASRIRPRPRRQLARHARARCLIRRSDVREAPRCPQQVHASNSAVWSIEACGCPPPSPRAAPQHRPPVQTLHPRANASRNINLRSIASSNPAPSPPASYTHSSLHPRESRSLRAFSPRRTSNQRNVFAMWDAKLLH